MDKKVDNTEETVNVDALFMGPKSENHKYFKETLNFLMDEHIHWRRDFHPDDKPVISLREQREADFEATLERTTEALLELSSKLKASSMPWFSARYLGHMNADTLMAANLAYMATILYNPNNCAYEGSPATTALEIEVGKQFATMLGFDPEKAWGHITTDGTIANYEGLWVARNLKSIPHAIKEVKPDLVEGMDDWQLLNLPTGKILDLVSEAKEAGAGVFEAVRERSVRGTGMQSGKLGKLLVPQSKHYSWTKAADVLGIGQANMVYIQVKENYRMDIDVLRETIDKFVSEKTPILGVVTVAGTTEEGAIDEVHEIVKLRDEYEKAGVSFYIHVDAAYGGYMRSVFLNEDDRFMDYDDLKERLHNEGVLHKEIDWPSRDVYEAYKAMGEVDSITLDPHKMGYVPYAAGGIALKDKRAIDLISYFAAYVFEKTEDNPMLLGSYILEGSKSGAAAAAVWTAHRVVPLNILGYGRIIGRSVEGAARFYDSLLSAKEIEAAGRKFVVVPLTRPDFNIVDFAFNEVGNTSLEAMDELNQKIYEQCSYNSGPVFNDDWITSKTDLAYVDYGDAPKPFVARLGIPAEEWDAVRSVYVIRSCVLTPFLTNNTTYAEYWGNFMNTMRNVLAFVVNSE